MNPLILTVAAPDPEPVLAELETVIREHLGAPYRPARPPAPPTPGHKGLDPLTLTAVVLAIPGALLAAADYDHRRNITAGLRALIAKARTIRGANPHFRLYAELPDGRVKPLESLDPTDIPLAGPNQGGDA